MSETKSRPGRIVYRTRNMRADLHEYAKCLAFATRTSTEEVINRALAIGLPMLARQIKEAKAKEGTDGDSGQFDSNGNGDV